MKSQNDKHSILTAVLLGLVCLLLVLCGVLFWRYRRSPHAHFGNPYQAIMASLARKHVSLGVADIDTVVQPWATFDYINTLFKLPPAYLQTQLSITDSHYPRVHLSRYAKSKNIDANVFLAQVKEAIRSYLAPVVPVPAASSAPAASSSPAASL